MSSEHPTSPAHSPPVPASLRTDSLPEHPIVSPFDDDTEVAHSHPSSPIPGNTDNDSHAPQHDLAERAASPPASVTSSDAPQPANTSGTNLSPQPAGEHTQPPAQHFPPEVESLMGMFPDLDPTIIQSVLESVGGDQERATDALLGMSDPDYVSQNNDRPVLSQAELDEQFARNLVLEEQRQHQQRQSDWENQLGNDPRNPASQYQGRQGSQGNQWGNSQGSGKDTMTEVTEQFSKLAETGKKTFASIVTKVKAKMQDFEANRNTSANSQQSQSSWGNSGGPSDLQHDVQHNQQPSYYQPPSGRPPSGSAGDQSISSAPSVPSPKRVPVPSAEISELSSSTDIPRPPTTSPGPPAGNIDPSKIGFLPKRPVSLVNGSPQPQPSQTNARHEDDDDDGELEYVENPFEDRRH